MCEASTGNVIFAKGSSPEVSARVADLPGAQVDQFGRGGDVDVVWVTFNPAAAAVNLMCRAEASKALRPFSDGRRPVTIQSPHRFSVNGSPARSER